MLRLWVRLLAFLFAVISMVALSAAAVLGSVLADFDRELPDYGGLKSYEPPVMTRVHAADGSILAEYAHQRRLFLPIQVVPKLVIGAFLSAEDKNFYSHPGVDPAGMLRAVFINLRNRGSGRRPEGASTITQQVAKNFFLTNTVSYRRKLEEALLAFRLEEAYSKDKILELYLNQIYLGSGSYGIAAASLDYFGKPVSELSVAEAAYLAALPKAPNNYNPVHDHDAAIARRDWVIGQMAENGYITAAEARAAQDTPLTASAHHQDPAGVAQADYFAEEVRRQLLDRYGEDRLYEGGLSVRTTLDPRLQHEARTALVDGLVRWDQREGYRGPVANLPLGDDWAAALAAQKGLDDIAPWRLAIVLDAGADHARIGLKPQAPTSGPSTEPETGTLDLAGVAWAHWASGPLRGRRITRVSDVVKTGDVVYVEPTKGGTYALRQVPEISGALVAMDPFTGRVLAMVGGFSFDQSNFNRATQAYRQPGSSFKPFIYAAALDNGYTPSTLVLDAPIEIDPGGGQPLWRPVNDGGKYYGPRTLRFGLEWSRNVMTVRLAEDMGMPLIADYARRFGIYDDMPPYIAMSLGSGETTLMRMATAYAMLANGGRQLSPTLIDRIQDRWGETIYRHDQRICQGCDAAAWQGQDEPRLIDDRQQVLDPLTAYQITSMLEGVVQRGTATVLKALDRPIAGKTGTTNESKDVWFIGYTPHLVAGVYIGYDTPRALGYGATGGHVSAPIVGEFLRAALAGKPAEPFPIPPGIKLIPVDGATGLRTADAGGGSILEAFKVGTAPPETYSVIGSGGAEGQSEERPVVMGTGSLY
ncbi:penicillin-binding protein 1A [Labrys wisconsinensis]|uniref:Penicillin-binding protein 1A n=1 Tax=Labrys wisconsinensis TaxID=425677 RepID=A0ABU0JFV4_9HYPH|nr:penicillin-binding protein 1A [Labrys wisconsinensis]MDQ0473164.1 penicillin-binding protein 1A [Labrys wisconsinensis]